MQKYAVVVLALLLAMFMCVGSVLGKKNCCGYSSPGNPYRCYRNGNCTWWGWYKRPDLPAWRGSAKTWLSHAQDDGIPTGDDPIAGSIACFNDMFPPYGHVAYVESVNPDGSFNVTEMAYVGWTCVRSHTYLAGSATGFIYGGPAGDGLTYTCSYLSQSSIPSAVVPGQELNLWVKFKNEGSATWSKSPGSNYVELGSCDINGNIVESFFNSPCGSAPGWASCNAPTSFDESSIAPGGTATFTFTGKVKESATPGTYRVYFGPVYDGEVIPGWSQMQFEVEVVDDQDFPSNQTLMPLAGDFNRDGQFEVGVYVVETRIFYLDTDDDGVADLALSYGNSGDIPLVGDWNGNGYSTIAVYRPGNRTFYLDYENDRVANLTRTFGNIGDKPIVGDWNGNNRVTIGLRRPSNVYFYLDYNNDCVTDLARAFGNPSDQPLAGDWNGNGRWTIGVYRPGNRTFYLDYDNNGSANYSRAYGDNGDKPVVGDWNGNGRMTIGVFRPSNRTFYLDYDNNGSADRSFVFKKSYTLPKANIYETSDDALIPSTVELSHNYPNPFNPVTTISYMLPEASNVQLEVFNILGQKVATLVNERQEAGQHEISWAADQHSSGVYFYRLQAGEVVETKKMVLLK